MAWTSKSLATQTDYFIVGLGFRLDSYPTLGEGLYLPPPMCTWGRPPGQCEYVASSMREALISMLAELPLHATVTEGEAKQDACLKIESGSLHR